MKKNVGTIDRIIRIVLALVFAYLYLSQTVTGVVGIILLVLGIVFLFTDIVCFSLLHIPFDNIPTVKK
jgi:hypothetical protein